MTAPDTLARHEAKTEPPKRWRNLWLRTVEIPTRVCMVCSARMPVVHGRTDAGHCDFPSENEARRVGDAALAHQRVLWSGRSDIYLGAYPEPAP